MPSDEEDFDATEAQLAAALEAPARELAQRGLAALSEVLGVVGPAAMTVLENVLIGLVQAEVGKLR